MGNLVLASEATATVSVPQIGLRGPQMSSPVCCSDGSAVLPARRNALFRCENALPY